MPARRDCLAEGLHLYPRFAMIRSVQRASQSIINRRGSAVDVSIRRELENAPGRRAALSRCKEACHVFQPEIGPDSLACGSHWEESGGHVDLAVEELRFTVKDSRTEVDLVQENLRRFQETESFLASRAPLGGTGSSVSLMLSYNGSAYLKPRSHPSSLSGTGCA